MKGLNDMKTRILIDGSAHTGSYRATCDCTDVWLGRAESTGVANWSPALPIAEAVVHMKMCHPNAYLDLQFTDRFRGWLTSYWEHANMRLMHDGPHSNFGRTTQAKA